MPRRSIKIMISINFRVIQRRFENQLIRTAIEEASELHLLLFKIRDQLTRDILTYTSLQPRFGQGLFEKMQVDRSPGFRSFLVSSTLQQGLIQDLLW
jgi:hypothetical protein